MPKALKNPTITEAYTNMKNQGRWIENLVSQILPARCPVSGEIVATQGSLSPKSWQALNFISDPFCACCGLPLEVAGEGEMMCGACAASPKSFRLSRSAVVYDDASRGLILSFKHGDKLHLTRTFVPWLKTAGKELLHDADMLVPVPLHWRRLIKRRYNQSALIAQQLAKETSLIYMPDALKRIRHTPVQGHLSVRERYKNVANAFASNPKRDVKDKNVVLIDDVYTTGATIEACTEVLYAAGASRVDVLTVARVSKSESIA